MTAKVTKNNIFKLKTLYYREGKSMSEIASYFKVSIDAVVYAMRKNNLKRRNFSEANKIVFLKKKPSFKKRKISSLKRKEFENIISMLYWGEGFKGRGEKSHPSFDFANSDPKMIKVFINCLRKLYILDEKKLRIYLYCYSNQNISKTIDFWSSLTKIPKNQFSKPYIKESNKVDNVMSYGLIHIRYSDKKLLIEIKNLIHSISQKYA